MSLRFPCERGVTPFSDAPVLFDHEMAELSLLLPGWQAAALEKAAKARGVTAGELLLLPLQATRAADNRSAA